MKHGDTQTIDGSGKMKPDNLRKTDVVNKSKNGESETFIKALLEKTNHNLTRNS